MLSLWLLKWKLWLRKWKKFDLKGANKITGNIKVYNNDRAIWKFCSKYFFAKFRLWNFIQVKNYNVSIGNSKSTIHLYLRTLRSIYNKGILVHRLVDENLLQAFDGLKTRSFDSQKILGPMRLRPWKMRLNL
jgi:hypothetical protein